MTEQLFDILGKIAGIAGIAFGLIVFVFRDVIGLKIFPELKKSQSYNIINKVVIFSFILGLIGIASWVLLKFVEKHEDSSYEKNLPNMEEGFTKFYPIKDLEK